jgi:hypothetical protein
MDIPYEKQFHFRDGTSVGSLEQLKRKIESISYQEFYFHVNVEKNDFANWVYYVLREEQLAADLRKVTSIVETVEIINDYLHPRPITAMRTDAQSRIEQAIFTNPMPAESNVQVVIEQAQKIPASTPKNDALDFKIIEEKASIKDEKKENLQPKVTAAVSEELFSKSQPVHKTATINDTDVTRLIVKDFMYGLVFGLLIGLILGRIIS